MTTARPDQDDARPGLLARLAAGPVICAEGFLFELERAEAVGRTTEASRYSEKMANHFLYGTNERIADHIRALGDRA
jgi:alkanesulfonate monooxygenase SsuD/methylene tetrahydromethanopterin reductase-like flavin-dependent oxidoreductase (luciferase family)